MHDTIITPLSVDVSTGDVITPRAVNDTFSGIFDDALFFDLWAYNIETVMAEKVETILRRSVFNTRLRDFHDSYILYTAHQFDKSLFLDALSATAAHRGTIEQISDIPVSIKTLAASKELRNMWDGYRKQFTYAKDITYDMIITALTEMLI